MSRWAAPVAGPQALVFGQVIRGMDVVDAIANGYRRRQHALGGCQNPGSSLFRSGIVFGGRAAALPLLLNFWGKLPPRMNPALPVKAKEKV